MFAIVLWKPFWFLVSIFNNNNKHVILIGQFGTLEYLFKISYNIINIGQIEKLALVVNLALEEEEEEKK